ncbi:hypothetical protein D3Z62_23165 [Lachnospiraceae bacterium]|nr:hypothetical protein [Lachnospiraceae bacterium]
MFARILLRLYRRSLSLSSIHRRIRNSFPGALLVKIPLLLTITAYCILMKDRCALFIDTNLLLL